MTDPARPPATNDGHDRPGRLFWLGVVAGWALIAVGVWGLVSDGARTRPQEALGFVLGAALVHDLVLAPAVVVAGWALSRVVRGRARGPVQAGVVVSSMVVLFSVPFVRGWGRVATNPSILPRDYGAGLAVVLGAVWVAVALTLVIGRWSPRRCGRSPRAW